MRHRNFAAACAVLVLVVLAPAFAAEQGASEAPRMPWGAPDLQGVWDFRSITPMERPRDRADQEFLTEEEAAFRRTEQRVAATACETDGGDRECVQG